MSTLQKPSSLGIKETTQFFDLVDEIISAVDLSTADGKISLIDIPNFMGVPVKLVNAFVGIEKIDDELADLDPAEIAELESRIDKYAKNPRYGNLVGHFLAAGNEVVAIIKESKAAKA